MTDTFGAFLYDCMLDAEMNQAEFAAAVGRHSGVVSRIRTGKLKPPLRAMESWGDVLRLSGARRERFIELAELAHVPQRLAFRYLAMQERLRALEKTDIQFRLSERTAQ